MSAEFRAPAYLRTEYRVNPLGIDVRAPRLSWEVRDERRGALQTAFRVIASSSIEKLNADEGDLWDTGKVETNRSIHVVYEGAPLGSRQRCWWKVKTWDAQGAESPWSDVAWFEMGLLDESDWDAHWIAAPIMGGKYTTAPCPYVRVTFTADKPVAQARLYATALGVYECSLNGTCVADDVFAPYWTDYFRRLQYQVYDVTGMVHHGDNVLGAILGDGWYCGHVEWRGRQRWGDRPKLYAQLEITFEDGTTQVVHTDETWKTSTGPILESDMLMGESYDARLEMPGWDAPGFDDAAWQPVQICDAPGMPLVAMCGPPVRRREELVPLAPPKREQHQWRKPKWIFNMGQNMVGRVRLKISGEAGTTVTLRFAEMLNPDGSLYTTNLRTAKQTDHYTLKGGGEEIYEPRFTFHGFQYVEVSGWDGELSEDAITGVVLYSDMELTGTFECSDELVNQLQHNIQWGQRGNFVDVPTDCPQRDERLGWTGDAQVFVRTAAFNMDVAGFFTKWTHDLIDSQSENGLIPPVVPHTAGLVEADGGPGWADALIICPWTMYLCYGDTRLLEETYPAFVKFIESLDRDSKDGIRAWYGCGWQGFGDWLSINADTPKDLLGTAFYAYSARLLSNIALVLGKDSDAAKYEHLFKDVRAAFQRRFVTPDGVIAGQTQTAYVLGLHFDLLPDNLRAAACRELVNNIESRGMQLSTGFLGAPYIQQALTAMDRIDIAYNLLLQTNWPSWLYSVTQGATTIWERWDGWTHDKGFQDPGMNSFNHYAYGSVGAWLYQVVAGIEIDMCQPAYKRVIIHPRPDERITSARATLHTVYGMLEVAWHVDAGAFCLDLRIPANTTATVYMPKATLGSVTEGGTPVDKIDDVREVGAENGDLVFEIGAGTYAFAALLRDNVA